MSVHDMSDITDIKGKIKEKKPKRKAYNKILKSEIEAITRRYRIKLNNQGRDRLTEEELDLMFIEMKAASERIAKELDYKYKGRRDVST